MLLQIPRVPSLSWSLPIARVIKMFHQLHAHALAVLAVELTRRPRVLSTAMLDDNPCTATLASCCSCGLVLPCRCRTTPIKADPD